jgi:CubicO group peptidase (beta-lactamase class C family)
VRGNETSELTRRAGPFLFLLLDLALLRTHRRFVLESRIHPLHSGHLHWLMKCIAFVFFLAVQLVFASGSGPLPAASPKRLGFSPERLERLHKAVQAYIDEGKHAGAISIIVRDGKICDFATYGYRDLEAKTPMTPDTICRVYSMSKVIASAAVMQLVERGEISLTDPVAKYIPEFKSMKVCTGGTAEEPTLVDATNAITVKHLLTHTAGLAYDFSQVQPVRQLYAKADLWMVETRGTLDVLSGAFAMSSHTFYSKIDDHWWHQLTNGGRVDFAFDAKNK